MKATSYHSVPVVPNHNHNDIRSISRGEGVKI